MEYFFVYGTLGPNRPNAHILENIDPNGSWQNASIQGKLEKKGWGAEMGFPGLSLSSNDNLEEIQGFVFSSNKLADNWAKLDEFEGQEYKRQFVTVNLETGEKIQAHVYALA